MLLLLVVVVVVVVVGLSVLLVVGLFVCVSCASVETTRKAKTTSQSTIVCTSL